MPVDSSSTSPVSATTPTTTSQKSTSKQTTSASSSTTSATPVKYSSSSSASKSSTVSSSSILSSTKSQQPKVFSFFDRLYDVQIGFFNLHIVGPCESEAIRTIDTSQDNKRETGVHLKPKEPFIDQHCLAYQVLIIYGFDSKVVKICLLEAHDKRDLKAPQQ
ncbi:hypothetical protein LTR42_005727 [Elasticomyces elasticus]|nr:hypothetical protein LTR42_005727 [Elasticomyces elasticus]